MNRIEAGLVQAALADVEAKARGPHALCPRRGRGTRALLLALVFGCCSSLPIEAADDYRDAYRSGVAAFEAGDWRETVRWMREAIALRADGRTGFRRRYTPYYFLGAAQAELGDCTAALATWNQGEGQGHIQKTKDWEDQQARRRGCEQVQAALEQERGAAQKALEEAQLAHEELENLRSRPELESTWGDGEESLQDLAERGLALLRESESTLADRGSSTQALRQAASRAVDASALFARVATAAEVRLNAVAVANASAREDLAEVEGGARRLLSSIGDLRPFPPNLAARVAAVEEQLNELEAAKGQQADIEEMEGLQRSLGQTVRRLRNAAARPPRSLQQAARALLGGNAAEAMAILEEQSYRGRQQVFAHLLSAAARHRLFVMGGAQDQGLADQARLDVLAAADADPAPVLSETYFSPSFTSFYRETVEARDLAAAAEEVDGVDGAAATEAGAEGE